MLRAREVNLIRMGIEIGKATTLLAGFGLALMPIIDEKRECCRLVNVLTGLEEIFNSIENFSKVREFTLRTIQKLF